MRQGQQNRRGRGRNTSSSSSSNNNNSNNTHSSSSSSSSNNNSRKPHSPLSRNFESSGPDVKIRGTAPQIAEKYMTLARDASSSGDIVMAENYLQHAEHYNRIIMAAQAQAVPQHPQASEHGVPNGHHRQQPDNMNNFGMRDQPQPVIEPQHQSPQQHQPQQQYQPPQQQSSQQYPPQPAPQAQPPAPALLSPVPGMEPQPEIVAATGQPASEEVVPSDLAADGRRRRRRYPAGGTAAARAPAVTDTAAEPAAANGHAGSGNGLDSAGDAPRPSPSDPALAN